MSSARVIKPADIARFPPHVQEQIRQELASQGIDNLPAALGDRAGKSDWRQRGNYKPAHSPSLWPVLMMAVLMVGIVVLFGGGGRGSHMGCSAPAGRMGLIRN